MHEEAFNLLAIPPEDWAQTPESVRLAVQLLLDLVQAQRAELNELHTRVRDLEAKLGQTSRTSSKPPSSDPPTAPAKPARVPRGRSAGGQLGHQGHQRPLVPPEQVDEPIDLLPDQCSSCHSPFAAELATCGEPRRTQVWELPASDPHITEYRQHTRCCPSCQQLVTAPLPSTAPPGAFGPRATALVALLRGRYRLSLDDTAELLGDVWNLSISPASIVTSCERASSALAPVDAAIAEVVQAAPQVNADETSWSLHTGKGWLWVAVCTIATSFRLHSSRGRLALRVLLGEGYRGIVGSDRWSAYGQYAPWQRQLCWAHLRRNLLALAERYEAATRWAHQMLALTNDLFLLWHLYKEGTIDLLGLHQALLPVRVQFREQLDAGVGSPHEKIACFSRDLLKQWEALWTFSRQEEIEPTNNGAERALRHAVLWRKGCFGSRSEAGARFVERFLSVRATCAQQQRSLFGFVTEAVEAAWAGRSAPLLVQFPAAA